jgi:hypothetical protein
MYLAGSAVVLKKTIFLTLLWIPLLVVAEHHVRLNSEVADTMTFEEIFRKIQSQTAGLLGDGYRQALPLPVIQGNAVILQVIIAPSVIREPEGTIIFPPTYLGLFQSADGSLLKLMAVDPSHFGQSHPVQEKLGVANMPEGMTFDQFINMRAELFAAYDLLIPPFSRREVNLNEQQYKAVASFLTGFPQLSEAVLRPYYEFVGKEFFTWLQEKRGQ